MKYNKKVKNAKEHIYNDIKFKSGLELFIYKRLTELGIEFEYENNRYILIPKFTYHDENIREMTYKPDFVGHLFILEAKGYGVNGWDIKEKLIKHLLSKYPEIKFYVIHSQKQFKEIENDLVNRDIYYKYISESESEKSLLNGFIFTKIDTKTGRQKSSAKKWAIRAA